MRWDHYEQPDITSGTIFSSTYMLNRLSLIKKIQKQMLQYKLRWKTKHKINFKIKF
jgi:hypothetical protein